MDLGERSDVERMLGLERARPAESLLPDLRLRPDFQLVESRSLGAS